MYAIGYKLAKTIDDKYVIVTLKIPADALHNMDRPSVINVHTAKHRCNKAFVLKIEDENGSEYLEAETYIYQAKKLKYEKGKMIEEPSYSKNKEDICAPGIHFFLTREVAEQYDMDELFKGILRKYYDSGSLRSETTYENRFRTMIKEFYDDGGIFTETKFKIMNGKTYSITHMYHKLNDFKYIIKMVEDTCLSETMYFRNKDGVFETIENGLYESFYPSGELKLRCNIVKGYPLGLFETFYKSGNICTLDTWNDGFLNGVSVEGYESGKMKARCYYNEAGRIHGLYERWDERGELISKIKYENGAPYLAP